MSTEFVATTAGQGLSRRCSDLFLTHSQIETIRGTEDTTAKRQRCSMPFDATGPNRGGDDRVRRFDEIDVQQAAKPVHDLGADGR